MINQKKICLQLIAFTTLLSQVSIACAPAYSQNAANDVKTEKSIDKSSSDCIFKPVEELLKEGKYSKALSVVEPILNKLKLKKDIPNTIQAYIRLSLCQRKLNRFLEAQRSLKFALGLSKPKEDDFEENATKSRILFYLADIEDELGQYVNTYRISKQGLEAVRQLAIGGRLPYLETELTNIYAHSLITRGELAEAEKTLKEAAFMADSLSASPEEEILEASPMSREKEFLKAKILVTKSILNEVQGKIPKSTKLASDAASIFDKYKSETLEESRYATYLIRLHLKDEEFLKKVIENENLTKAALLEVQSEKAPVKEAITLLEESLKLKSSFLETSSATIGNTKIKLAKLYLKNENAKKAALLANEGYSALTRAVENTSPQMAQATAVLAKSYLASGETRGVERLLSHAWKIEAKRLGNDSPEVLSLMDATAELYLKQKRYKKAVRLSIPVTTKREQQFGTKSTALVPSLLTTGTAYAQLRMYKRAQAPLSRAKSILESNGKTKTAQYADVLASIGINDTHNYKWDKAKISLRKAVNLYKELYGEKHPNTLAMRQLYRTMYNKRSTIPGLNKNLLKGGPIKLRPPDNYGH